MDCQFFIFLFGFKFTCTSYVEYVMLLRFVMSVMSTKCSGTVTAVPKPAFLLSGRNDTCRLVCWCIEQGLQKTLLCLSTHRLIAQFPTNSPKYVKKLAKTGCYPPYHRFNNHTPQSCWNPPLSLILWVLFPSPYDLTLIFKLCDFLRKEKLRLPFGMLERGIATTTGTSLLPTS